MIRETVLLPIVLLLSFIHGGWTQDEFPVDGLLPKRETGALRFLKEHPNYDGRGITVAILDSGIDPGVEGLQRTPDGRPKIVDVVDATGSGDVATTCIMKADSGVLMGLTGRKLTINKDWKNPSGHFHLGMKAAWEFFPSSLTSRLKKDRLESFETRNHDLRRRLLAELTGLNSDDKDKDKRIEWQARIDALDDMLTSYQDPGPIFDCVVFHDGSQWQTAIDTNENGDLGDETVLTNYRTKRQFASFGDETQLNFAVNIREEGKLLSIVVPSNMHGTHVAGIVGGYYPEEPELNGLAPGVQFVSVKIGDSRLDGMETGSAVVRGLKAVIDHGCEMINMSYGEPTRLPDQGRLMRLIDEVVHEHRVVFVASAGNAGPALTTVGAPGGSSSSVIGVGAYVTPAMRKAGYSLMKERPDMAFTWSSRGPTSDGAAGVSICAPGGALAPVPNWTLRRNRWANGTSMSSPNACGSIALLLSALEQEEIPYSAHSIRRAVENTATPIPTGDRTSQGYGLLQIDRAYEQLKAKTMALEPRYDVRIPKRNNARGLYLREAPESDTAQTFSVTVAPKFTDHFPNHSKLQLNQRLILTSTEPWVACPEALMQTNKLSNFKIHVDPSSLEPGLHLAEVHAVDVEHPELGPVFRLPITVVRPHNVTGTFRANAYLFDQDQDLAQHFLTPPAGTQWARIQVRSKDQDDASAVLHVQQNVEQRRHPESGFETQFTLTDEESETFIVPIEPNRTVEVTLADYWSNEHPLNFEMQVDFIGLATSSDGLNLSASQPVDSVALTAALDHTKLQPSASLTHWLRDVSPSSSELRPLSPERDAMANGQGIHELILTYPFSLSADSKVLPSLPSLNQRLYESDIQSQLWMLFDANKQLLATDDGWKSSPVSLKKGDYTARYHLRHDSAPVLERLKSLPMALVGTLNKTKALKLHATRSAALVDGPSFGSVSLSQGDRRQVHVSALDIESIKEEADVLIGSLRLSQEAPRSTALRIEYRLPSDSTSKGADDEEKYKDSLQEKVDALAKVDDVATRKKDHRKIVDLCDQILAEIDNNALALHRGQRHSPDEAEENRAFNRQFQILTDTLYRKARAIAYHDGEHEKRGESYDPKPFEEAFAELERWVDTKDSDFVLTHIRNLRRQENFGQALQMLNKHMKTAAPSKLLFEKRVKILTKLDWIFWAEHETQWNRLRMPESYPLF